jgi:feruloyl-CoA synthase
MQTQPEADTATKPAGTAAWPVKTPDVQVERRADGSILIRCDMEPVAGPRSMGHLFVQRAQEFPERPFLKQRAEGQGPWRSVSYGDALAKARSIAQWLLDRGMTHKDCIMILSGNSIEHALLLLAGYLSGIPVAPVSAAYSLLSTDYLKLRHCFSVLRPRVVFAYDGKQFAAALQSLKAPNPDLICITLNNHAAGEVALDTVLATQPRTVDAALHAVNPQSVAKYLFTSGSTGLPKAVVQTHGMMTAFIGSQEALRDETQDVPDEVPENLEWMPWSHISAGNIVFNGVLWNSGTLYLDDGKPTEALFPLTIRNLRDVSPQTFGSAPIAFGMLADAMEKDPALRRSFFKNLRYLAYGGATLSGHVFARLQALAIAETGKTIPLLTMYGATETQGVTFGPGSAAEFVPIGSPMPGVVLKLVPNGAKLELRIKSPTVTPGYVGDPDRNAAAWDEEGFYKPGDAARLLDEADPNRGLVFDGRVGEDFKLATGTWVSVGPLRAEVVRACSPYVFDAVIAGHERGFVSVLLWPAAAAMPLIGAPTAAGLLSGEISAIIADKLRAHNAAVQGSSRQIRRFALMAQAPSLDAGEITDKGSINQRGTLAQRRDLVTMLYAEPPGAGVIVV